MSKTMRVAIIGASGIGRHHGNWWTLEGAEVCAFAGTSDASVAKTREALQALFGFQGRGYTNVDEMLHAESPDIVDVCSPPSLHYEHARAALESNAHVLCEKPLVYDPTLSRETLMKQAEDLVALAERQGKRFGVCMQYVAGARIFMEMWSRVRRDEEITQVVAHLASPAKGRAPDPARIWMDLAPHPLSMLPVIVPQAEIAWDTLGTRFEGYEALAWFRMTGADRSQVACIIRTQNTTEPPPNIRKIEINDYEFVVEAGKDEHGVYCSRIVTPDGERIEPDLMRKLIRRFLSGRLLVDGAAGVLNVDWSLRILEAGREGSD